MDFIIVLMFLLVMSSVVYRRLVDGKTKNAVPKKRPPLRENRQLVRESSSGVEEEEIPLCVVPDEIVHTTPKKESVDRFPKEKSDGKEKDICPAALRDVAEARRAFIYSEIFRRKYE